MLTRTQKEHIVSGITDQLERQNIVIFSDFHGASVSHMQSMRRELKQNEAEYKVIKKTLLDRALKQASHEVDINEFKGELGVAFGYGDQIAPAKILAKFGKEVETFKILGGILDGSVVDAQGMMALARLPGREALLGQLAGTLMGPIRGLAVVLQANIRSLVYVLDAIKNKK